MRRSRNKPAFVDLADHDEDKRIEIIGRTVMKEKKTACVVTDSDPGKAERYIRKLVTLFPGIRVVDRFDGPVPNTVVIKLAPPL